MRKILCWLGRHIDNVERPIYKLEYGTMYQAFCPRCGRFL